MSLRAFFIQPQTSFFLAFAVACVVSFSALAQETTPGTACTGQTHLYRMAGGPELAGTSYLLSCNGTTWQAVTAWDSSSARSLFQVNNDTGACNSTKLGRVRYNGTATWEYCNGTSWTTLGGALTFLGLTDTPATYASQGGKYLRVNTGESAVEFTDQIVQQIAGLSAPTDRLLNDLGDVVVSSPANGQILSYNGTNWVNSAATSTPGGSSGQVQFNNASAFGGSNNLF